VVTVARSSRGGGLRDEGVKVVENLAHFEFKRTVFNMDNTIFPLRSGAHDTAGDSNRSRGLSPPPYGPPHFNHWAYYIIIIITPSFHSNAIACVACVA